MAWVRRLITAIINMVLATILVLGPPVAFVYYDGASILQQAVLHDGSGVRSYTRQAAPLMIVSIGVFWLLTASVLLELGRRIRGLSTQRIPLLPLRGLASVLATGQAVTLLSPAASAAVAQPAPPSVTQPAAQTTASAPTSSQQDTTTVLTDDVRHPIYVVRKGDYLSKIARKHLKNSHRWTEICDLNRHRHFAVGGTLHDCNLIYPGWDLQLPADARPPHEATPVKPPTSQTPPPVVTPPTPVPSTSPNSLATTPSPSVASHPSITVSPGLDGPAVVPSVPASPSAPISPSPVTSSSPSESASASLTASDSESPQKTTDQHGVQLSPWSWLPWGLAAAISAAVALVWFQRRRRFTSKPDDDPPTMPPEPAVKLHRAVTRHPDLARAATEDVDMPVLMHALASLPPGGTGITGDGAPAAARAALVEVLTSGRLHNPSTHGEVVIDAATLATLLGPEAVTLGKWPRLRVADNIDDALTMIEGWLLHRSRILDEHALTNLDELRQQALDEETLPLVMLITETPPASARTRTKAALTLGSGLQVTGLILGEWAHGATIEVDPNGHTELITRPATEPVPTRLPVLDPATTIQILTILREAQTGETPAIVSPAVPLTVVPLHASRTVAAEDRPPAEEQPRLGANVPATPAATTGPVKAKLRVIGPPRIDGIVHDGRPLRAKAKELAVFLAVHPDGVETRAIGDNIELDARISQAAQRVHTNASNLRHVLGRAAVPDAQNAYIVKGGGGYKLDPTTVDVDVWTLRDLMRKATIASGPARRELLTAACDLYTAPLAEGEDYEWLAPHRETVRRWGTEAHLLLADDLLADHHSQEASDLLDKAIGLDRYNEALYVRAVHARHGLGDADGIRTLLRALTKALADLDAEPQDNTRTLAAKLRTSLEQR